MALFHSWELLSKGILNLSATHRGFLLLGLYASISIKIDKTISINESPDLISLTDSLLTFLDISNRFDQMKTMKK